MKTKKHIQAANYYAFLGDVQRLALKGTTWDKLPIRELHKRHHIGGWPKELLRGFDLKAPVSMDRACTLMAMACDYGRGMKATRDERGAHRTPAQDGEPQPEVETVMPEMEAMKEEVDRLFDKLPEMVPPVQDDDTIPFMSDREMIAALTRHGYIVCKPVNNRTL